MDADDVLTPYEIERRLLRLDKELTAATNDLIEAEASYHRSKTHCELELARTRINLAKQLTDRRMTVQEKEDMALTMCEKFVLGLAADEAWVRGSRANLARIRTQIDIARSLGTSVRSSMEVL